MGCCPFEGDGSVVVVDSLIDAAIVGVCNCSTFCCALLYVHSTFAIILMGKREPVALLCLSSWYLVIVMWLFLAVPWVCLQFVIVVFPDHTHYMFTIFGSFLPLKISQLCCSDRVCFLSTTGHMLQ